MNKVEKIREEIEKRKDDYMAQATSFEGLGVTERTAYYSALASNMASLILFIDSLSDTEKDFGIKSNDLEEAAHSYVDTTIEWFDSEGNPCCYPAFIAGAQWQKEQMMKDAVDGEIYFSMDYLQYRINTEPLAHFHHGDKVKLIIVKEE